MRDIDMWSYREDQYGDQTGNGGTLDLTGFSVEALDGSIGKVDEATNDPGRNSIVVDTGPWIFGKKVLLPAGVIDRVDTEEERVYVHRTKDEIKGAPEYSDTMADDESFRQGIGGYYGPGGAGYREYDSDRAYDTAERGF